VRIFVLTNDPPRFNDDSGALASRFVVLEIGESFYGREDVNLKDKLLVERPGILNWALDGWNTLRLRKHFIQPESGREAAENLALSSSIIKSFVEDRCELGPDFEIECGKLHAVWKGWKDVNGIRLNLLVNQFSAKLRVAYSQISTERPREDDPKRPRHFGGIRLKPKAQKAGI
jgi:putative DNA primase/helicase